MDELKLRIFSPRRARHDAHGCLLGDSDYRVEWHHFLSSSVWNLA
jgi:hypothetical protein